MCGIGAIVSRRTSIAWLVAAACGLPGAGGCGSPERRGPFPLESLYAGRRTVAVVPMLGGDRDLDPLHATDLFYSEIQQVNGFAIVPINRLLAEMADAGYAEIRTIAELADLGVRTGADAVIIFDVTEYNPYSPPTVGIVCQLYLLPRGGSTTRPAGGGPAVPTPVWTDEVTEIYNASHEDVVKLVKEFADYRNERNSPLGWRIYLEDQKLYLRFAFNQVIRALLRSERARLTGGVLTGQEVRS